MAVQGKVEYQGFTKWMNLGGVQEPDGIRERCTADYLQKYLNKHVKMRDVVVVSAHVNTEGTFTGPNLMGAMGEQFPPATYTGLPTFCQVELHHSTGKHTETIWVWVPVLWNGRFIGCCGGGNRTAAFMDETMCETMRAPYLFSSIRNGFACTCSDGANRADEFFAWGVDLETKEFDLELYHNWIDYSTHTMTVLGKAVTEALTGEAPAYSYIMGASGGGRQVLAEAQKYPEDYDGYWADCPCVSYNRMLPALVWPAVVMNELNNAMPPAKFEAFRAAAWEKAGGQEAYYNTTEIMDVDPFALVGQETTAGPITELDAQTMQKIWEGARTPDGDFLWYGMRPGVTAWNMMEYSGVMEVDGRYVTTPFSLTVDYLGKWLLKDKDWDISKCTMAEFARLFRMSMELFPDMDTENPDLRNLRDCGGKLMICHGVDDAAIYVDGSIAYYEKIINLFGGKEKAKEVARLLIVPGDAHGSFAKFGAGPSLATALMTMMDWVENGNAPETVHGQRFDMATMTPAEEKDTPIY